MLLARSLARPIGDVPEDRRRSVRYPVSTLPRIRVDGSANL